jgi:CDP-L-myo-inositol myo-inositolphosphotransferase
VERTVLSLHLVGIREFALIGDPEARRRAAQRLRSGLGRRMRLRVVDGLPCAGSGGESAFVACADVYYDRKLVQRFVEEMGGQRDSVVVLDRRRELLEGPGGHAQVVLHPGGGIRSTGRELVAADGVLVGLALANPSFARTLSQADPDERAFARCVARLVEREPVATWNAAEPWQRLREARDTALARRKVLAGAVGLGDGIVARNVNRRISVRITERLVTHQVKPWQVSVLSFLGTLAAGFAFAMGHAATGGILAQSASVLDCVDGELARIRYQDSPFGGVYDALLDRIGEATIIGGMTLYAWLMGAGNSAVALGFAAVAGSSLSMAFKEKYGTQFRRTYPTEREGRWRWLMLGRDGRLFLVLLAGITGYVEAVLAYFAVGTHLQAGVRVYRLRAEAARA